MIRRLTREDIPVITDMLKESFPPELRPYMTYTQHGVGRFLEVAERYPHSVEPRHLVVGVDAGTDQALGFADFKVGDDGVGFLSYICVTPSARGRGLATAMFEDFLVAHPDLRTVKLDMFRENTAARRLYERWSFSIESTSAWVTRALPAAAEPPRVSGLTVSLAAHEAYGFCELQLESPGDGGKVGILGDGVIRCFTRSTFEDGQLLASARGLMGSLRTAFAILPESVERELEVRHDLLLLSDRMTLDVDRRRPQS